MTQTRLLLLVVTLTAACAGDDAEMGAQGAQGSQGSRGSMGDRGPAGERGPAGPEGPEGPQGLRGVAGPAGPAGPQGKDAAGGGYRPTAWTGCTLALDLISINSGGLGTDGVTETLLTYTFTRYVNNDLDVDCTASLGSAESAPGGSFYPAPTKGANTGGCAAAVDYPPFPPAPSNVGTWNFEFSGTGIRATYKDDDAGHPLNGRSFTFGENDCHCYQMNDSLRWIDASLADVI